MVDTRIRQRQVHDYHHTDAGVMTGHAHGAPPVRWSLKDGMSSSEIDWEEREFKLPTLSVAEAGIFREH